MKTLAQIKAERRALLARSLESLKPFLAAAAQRLGGHYVLYGSAARDDLRPDSDVDLMLDFPEAALPEATELAENACLERGLVPDLRPRRYCGAQLLERIERDGVVLG